MSADALADARDENVRLAAENRELKKYLTDWMAQAATLNHRLTDARQRLHGYAQTNEALTETNVRLASQLELAEAEIGRLLGRLTDFDSGGHP